MRNRRSLRLPAYDYAAAGVYFVTICTRDRACILSDIRGGVVHLTDAGRIAASAWGSLPEHVPGVVLDEWVVMPNHLHGIVLLTEREAPALGVRLAVWRAAHPVSSGPAAPSTAPPTGPAPRSLGAIVGSFKSATTRHINRWRSTPGAPVWQRGYHEHVVGDEAMLARIRDYIVRNPLQWTLAVPYGSIQPPDR